MAVPTFVNATVFTTGGGSIVATVPAGVANNDLLLLYVHGGFGAASALTGWTFLGLTNFGGSGCALYARLAASEPASYTLTVPAAEIRGTMHAWRPASGTWASVADAILAYRGHSANLGNATKPDSLWFGTCDYVLVGFGGKSGGYNYAVPTGWTSRGGSSGGGGGNTSFASGSKSVAATAGYNGVADNSWLGDGGAQNTNTWTVALRAPGQTTIALRSFFDGSEVTGVSAGSGVSSLAVTLPRLYAVGDLLVVPQGYKLSASLGALPTFGTPAGWAKKGTDQIYLDPSAFPNETLGCGVLYKIAASLAESCTISTSAAVSILQGVGLCFSTGPTGPALVLPGTMGQGNDGTLDSSFAFPAMTLDAQAIDTIRILYGALSAGNVSFSTPPAGFTNLARRAQSTAGDQNSAVIAAVLAAGNANPAAQSSALDASAYGVGVQFVVGLPAGSSFTGEPGGGVW